MEKVKRTYNLPERTVRLVRELSAEYGVAPTQDAVVELAVDALAIRLRDEEEARIWEEASRDPEFRRENEQIFAEFAAADLETWPPE